MSASDSVDLDRRRKSDIWNKSFDTIWLQKETGVDTVEEIGLLALGFAHKHNVGRVIHSNINNYSNFVPKLNGPTDFHQYGIILNQQINIPRRLLVARRSE